MPVVVVANPKGGVGKSTLSTNIAGYYASQGHPVILGDTDRQESAKLWLGLRPPAARPIGAWDGISSDVISRPPKGTTHAVLDTPAGLHGWRLNDVLKLADKIIVPLQAARRNGCVDGRTPGLEDLVARIRGQRVGGGHGKFLGGPAGLFGVAGRAFGLGGHGVREL